MRQVSSGFNRLDSSVAVQAIKQGLIMAIPILMIGSFALILKFLPIGAYQNFITSFLDGFLVRLLTIINQATFNILSISMTISISFSYVSLKTSRIVIQYGAMFTALSSYMVFIGLFKEEFTITSFAAQGMFTAVFCAIFSTAIFCWLVERDRFNFRLYTVGADSNFNNAVSIIFPACTVILLALALNGAISYFFGVAGFEHLFQKFVNALFANIENRVLSTILFVFLIDVFWFFGIHGSNVLESVARGLFSTDLVGGVGGELLTKNFLDVFVLMGGCGTTISLLAAILIFSKQKNNRGLAKMAAFPMLFNINELMLFGFPIVYNFALLAPFLITPFVCMLIAYTAITVGLVPPPIVDVEWITPIVVGGYVATGSIAGSILQLFNIAVGTGIYGFFLLRYEKKVADTAQRDLKDLVSHMQRSEGENKQIVLLDANGSRGAIAKMLAEDFKYMLKSKGSFALFYQPQYDHREECFGAEALLRWSHPRFGMIYPPLLIGIASETNLLGQLEKRIFEIASDDMKAMDAQGQLPSKISVNITASTLQTKEFCVFLEALLEENPLLRDRLCVELTEQMSFTMNQTIEEILERLRAKGVHFAIDDFSMGYTSLKYLQSNQFDIVKLDGSLIKDILDNYRSQEIVSSIIHMSENMELSVVAEYVETVQQRQKLYELGCHYYQGYLYSPAIPLEDFISLNRMISAQAMASGK